MILHNPFLKSIYNPVNVTNDRILAIFLILGFGDNLDIVFDMRVFYDQSALS